MRHLPVLGRRLFAILSALSLALLITICTLWVRSYCLEDEFGEVGWRVRQAGIWDGIGIYSCTGTLAVYHFQGPVVCDDLHHYSGTSDAAMRPHLLHRAERLSFPPSHSKPFRRIWQPFGNETIDLVGFPTWLPAIVLAILPAWHGIILLRHARRAIPGFCQTCGYDLRATPDRCPECGTAPTPEREIPSRIGASKGPGELLGNAV
ncbi:MAG TPA: hypothetical protein VFC78_11180 [Tepidisphaeraceae bacterium]|nr:hypothetical protein [Tepidisphaeraceae bacterium]